MRKEYGLKGTVRGKAVEHPNKTRITILLDSDIVAAFRARAENTGRGYQTAINQALREHLANEPEATLREVDGPGVPETATPSLGGQGGEYVVCVDNADHPASLELHKIYCSLPDDEAAASGGIRVVDESGDDYVFATGAFVPIQLPERVRASLRGDASSS